ncbi:MAG: methenyltetrahydromethanopterin cyclohydrolase [Planctomycetota bacterium]|nr:MAG: methenyltetrahydromethanopterin cyclohydrolase [Planctomycetota bacterium]REJ98571.1 MAG: methenyltetrahydromethanopterin cyclohydrolase [Planctomycetota bacterium]
MKLNYRAAELCREAVASADVLGIATRKLASGALLIDCGIEARGGLAAGLMLARACLADLGTVSLVPAADGTALGTAVQVFTDQPVAACMAAQYAGWEVKVDDFFAMGSGPMRAAANQEELFEEIGFSESPSTIVGVLETRQFPDDAVVEYLAQACGVAPRDIILLLAPTASQAGNVQVVGRSVETALHKLHEIDFDLERVVSGLGVAPLPPVAPDDLASIGRTNDAILYGAEVTLWVVGDDASLAEIGPRVPSNSSADHGRPFREIFAQHDHDFYRIDRQLFSPAVVTFVNLETGTTQRFGTTAPEVIRASFEI